MKILRVGPLVAALLLFWAPACHAGSIDAPERCMARGSLTMLPSGALSLNGEGAASVSDRWEVRSPTPKDLLLSLAIPGLGELRTGNRNRAIMHFAAEAAVWTTFIVFRVQGELRKGDYMEYAEVFGGVLNADGQSHGYYRDLARFRRSDPGPSSYNELEVRAMARALFPDDIDARKRYVEENEIHGARAWNWETEANWMTFGQMRESSEMSYQRSRFTIAAAIANRIASVLGLARARGPGNSTIDVGMRPVAGGEHYATTITLIKKF